MEESGGCSAHLWKYINRLTKQDSKQDTRALTQLNVDGKLITDYMHIANSLNTYFVTSVEKIAASFNPVESSLKPENQAESAFSISQINESNVKQIISKIKPSKSKDVFGVNSDFLRKFKDYLSGPLTHLVNLSITSEKFPQLLKQGLISLIFKAGDRDQACNYRPISILPVFSKVFEKVVRNQLIDYLEYHHILHPKQFGFRRKSSTELATCYLTDVFRKSLDKGNVVGAVFLDLHKAFDTVNHLVLLHKLKQLNFSQQTLSWFTSYSESRTQSVKINDTISEPKEYRIGIPQGSILGPILLGFTSVTSRPSALRLSVNCMLTTLSSMSQQRLQRKLQSY